MAKEQSKGIAESATIIVVAVIIAAS